MAVFFRQETEDTMVDDDNGSGERGIDFKYMVAVNS